MLKKTALFPRDGFPKEIIRYVHMWATKSVLLHKIGVESDFVFSTKPIIWTRVQDVNKSRYISHPAQYASLFFRVYSAWFMGWPVRHLFCMRGEIYCQNPRKDTRFFLNGSPLNISRDCFSPQNKLRRLAPTWSNGPPLGLSLEIILEPTGLSSKTSF